MVCALLVTCTNWLLDIKDTKLHENYPSDNGVHRYPLGLEASGFFLRHVFGVGSREIAATILICSFFNPIMIITMT